MDREIHILGTSPVTRAYLAEFASNLHSAIRDTADNAGLRDEYTEAINHCGLVLLRSCFCGIRREGKPNAGSCDSLKHPNAA